MDLAASVERRGIEPVPLEERQGGVGGLAAVWLAANLGMLSVVFGAILAAYGLDLRQACVVAVGATLGSFLLVGVVSVAGTWAGMPALTLSRRAFGRVGNLAPAGLSWVSILGWEVVTSVVAAWAVAELCHELFGVGAGRGTALAGLAVVVTASLALAVYGHATIVRFQRWAAWVFGGLSLFVVPLLAVHAHWAPVRGARPASAGEVLAAASVVAAGTGVSWVNLAPDYSRYLSRDVRERAIVGWVTAAAAVPTIVLVLVGYLLTARVPGLAQSLNPIGPVGAVLPSWVGVPYLLTAAGGMIAETDLACYSSGLNLLALGVRVPRSRTIFLDAGVVLAGGAYLLFGGRGFLAPFESFLELLADGLAAWAGVVLADMIRARRTARTAGNAAGFDQHYRTWSTMGWVGMAAWTAGTALGLLTTVCPWFTGPLARGVLAQGSFGYLLGLLVALAVASTSWGLAAAGCMIPSNATAVKEGRGGHALPERLDHQRAARPTRLVLAGSVLVDVLCYVEALPGRGDDAQVTDRLVTSGGGLNVLTAAARLGLAGAYAGRVGDGVFGQQVARDLAAAGVRRLVPPVPGEDTGFTVGVVEAGGQRTFLTAPGAESRLGPEDLARVRLLPGDAVYVSGYDLSYPVAGPALAGWIAGLPAHHLLAVDPGPLAAARLGETFSQVLPRVDLLSASVGEASAITTYTDPAEAAQELARLIASRGVAVVRVGAAGCWLAGPTCPADSGSVLHVPGWPVEAVDTTGAGDVHVGAMLAHLARGEGVIAAARAANAAASLAVRRPGGAAGPTATELAALLGGRQ